MLQKTDERDKSSSNSSGWCRRWLKFLGDLNNILKLIFSIILSFKKHLKYAFYHVKEHLCHLAQGRVVKSFILYNSCFFRHAIVSQLSQWLPTQSGKGMEVSIMIMNYLLTIIIRHGSWRFLQARLSSPLRVLIWRVVSAVLVTMLKSPMGLSVRDIVGAVREGSFNSS